MTGGLRETPSDVAAALELFVQRGHSGIDVRVLARQRYQPCWRLCYHDGDYFDLAHERLVLITLTSPQDVVAEMVHVVRPGGSVVTQNVDWISWTCEPAHPAWDSLLEALVKTFRATGLDPFTGRRMPALLRDAGLVDVAIEVFGHTERAGQHNHLLLLRFIGIFRDQITAGGFLDAPQLARLTGELKEHLSRPETFTLAPLLFQVWGRKPRLTVASRVLRAQVSARAQTRSRGMLCESIRRDRRRPAGCTGGPSCCVLFSCCAETRQFESELGM